MLTCFDADFPFREDVPGKVEIGYAMDCGEIGDYRVLLYPDMRDITQELSATEEEYVREAIWADHDADDGSDDAYDKWRDDNADRT